MQDWILLTDAFTGMDSVRFDDDIRVLTKSLDSQNIFYTEIEVVWGVYVSSNVIGNVAIR